MALYYDLGPLYETYKEDEAYAHEHLAVFCKKGRKVLKKVKLGIDDKKYLEVQRQLVVIRPYLEFLGMDLALEELDLIMDWTLREGKTKEVKEIYKVFRVHMKNAIKELQKDFNIVLS